MVDALFGLGIAALQYAGDTIIFVKEDVEGARNSKLSLYTFFEKMSKLKVIPEKSEILMVMEDNEESQIYDDLFNCEIGQCPIKYLGMPMCARRCTVSKMKLMLRD
jgi:hypothetical protein